MKDELRRLFLSTLDELSLDRHMPQKVVCRDGVLEVGRDRIELAPFKKILAVAIGKAAFPMAREMARIVAPRLLSGIAVSSVPPPEAQAYFITYQGGHPYPNEQSVYATDVTLEFLSDLKPHHLVIYLISGGGSAICEKPVSDDISLDDLREFYRLLVTCGADIVEMNVLRKHFSAIKGGRLAVQAHPARQLTLYVSDVPPDKPSSVASGPTLPDESTVGDCYEIVERRGLHRATARLDPRFLPRPAYPRDAQAGQRGVPGQLVALPARQPARRRPVDRAGEVDGLGGRVRPLGGRLGTRKSRRPPAGEAGAKQAGKSRRDRRRLERRRVELAGDRRRPGREESGVRARMRP